MSERVADAIEEIARPSRDAPPKEPPVQTDPARRRLRLFERTPAWLVAVLVVAVAVACAGAVLWVTGSPAVAERPELAVLRRTSVRVTAAVIVGLLAGWLVAWALRPTQSLRRGVRSGLLALRRTALRLPLVVSVLVAALLGLAMAVLVTWWLTGEHVAQATSSDPVDVVRAALPAAAGVLLAIALVLVVRRHHDTERGRFSQRFASACAQLGDSDVAVRIAGVYALAAIADEHPSFTRRQQCVDVLSAYLRLPYDPESGSNHLSEFVTTTTWTATAPATGIEERRRQSIRQNDREVRQTIGRVLTRHLLRDADVSWSASDFDFTGVLFEDASFAGARFSGRDVSFADATFRGRHTAFDDTRFEAQTVSFAGATFTAESTSFAGATFRARDASFDRATFTGTEVSFDDAVFAGEFVAFRKAAFTAGRTSFTDAAFTALHASFDSPVAWENVDFDWDSRSAADAPSVPKCITPRPWPPTVKDAESPRLRHGPDAQ